MNRTELQRLLEEHMERGHPHRAWDVARDLIEGNGDATLRRVLKYGFLREYLVPRLPTSFWDERRKEEARRLGIVLPAFQLRVGEVAFPVVFPARETGCFVVAAVRPTEAGLDELPPEEAVDADARRAMQAALDAARRLRGEQRRFRVSLDRPFPEPVKGASCGLAVALAALSCIDNRELDDGISATGEVTRELAVVPVRDLDRKSALRREARPLARLLCPEGDFREEGLFPVARLEDALAAVWKPTPRALEESRVRFQRALAEDPGNLLLPFRGLAKIARGSDNTTLELLGFAVAPSLRDGHKQQTEAETELRRALREQDLTPEARGKLEEELRQLERRNWGAHVGGDQDEPPVSFAEVLLRHRRFTVIGDAGAGKSLLTRLVFLACTAGVTGTRARELLLGHAGFKPGAVEAIDSLRELIPVRLILGDVGRALAAEASLSLEDYIRRQLRDLGARPALLDGLGELLAAGRLFLLCDGLDEVPEALRERVVDTVLAFGRSYPRVRLLVTSRPHGYYPQVDGFHHTRLAPLDYWQRRILVARLHLFVETRARPGPEGVARARRRTNELLQAIEGREEWEQLISNPLLLTLSALSRTNQEGVPEHQVIVFEGLIETILGEWRSALKRPAAEADRLLEVWSAVASELVQREQRDGVGLAPLLRMLSTRLEAGPAPSPIDAKTALNLALEAGLVREHGGTTISFWHSTFAEFLAARFLAGDGTGAVDRLLKGRLTPPTLQFAAALLDHVLEARDECNALARALLDRDRKGAHQLLRPGLRTVSKWLINGVRLRADTRERIWETWLEVLEKTPPSLLWGDFGRFANRVPPGSMAPRLAARLARVDHRRVEEVRDGLARVVAPYAAVEPAVRDACEHWLKESSLSISTLKLHGAFGLGLAAAGACWRDEVIHALGRFGTTRTLSPHAVRELVRNSGAPTLARLRALARERLPSDKDQPTPKGGDAPEALDEPKLRERRLAAACLLAVAGHWDEAVSRAMRLALAGQAGSFHDDELQSVMRFCAHQDAAREALLEWMSGGSALGERARKIVRDVAPLFEDMPQKVLECTARAEGRERQQLESLLVEMGEELHTLPDLLRRCLDEQREVEEQLCAARLLRQLAPEDRHLYEALRRGMRSRDEATRARWAHLARGLEQGLSEKAMETLQMCARSSDATVRQWAYGGEPLQLMWRLGTERLEGWLDCAADPGVAAAARLDAVEAVERVPALREQVVPILNELLDAEDPKVRRTVARKLLWRNALGPRVAAVLAEEVIQAGAKDYALLHELEKAAPFAAVIVPILLRGLAGVVPNTDSRDPWHEALSWSYVLRRLVEAELSCADDLLRALEDPGLSGDAAHSALMDLMEKHAAVRDAFRAHLREAATTGASPVRKLRLIRLGLRGNEKFPEALELVRTLEPGALTQEQLNGLARVVSDEAEREAVRLWRLVLEGEDLELVLSAAEMLVDLFPEEAAEWIHPAMVRLFDSPEPAHQIEASRLVLRHGILEEQARTALFRCLELAGQAFKYQEKNHWRWRYSPSRDHAPKPANGELLDELLVWPSRVDFEAMHAICGHWPEVGLSRLAAWLEDDDSERFSHAVKILANEDAYRDRVSAALENRLRSGPVDQLDPVVHLVEEHGFYSEALVEHLLTRFFSEEPKDRKVGGSLTEWLLWNPELWRVFRRQDLQRRGVLVEWLSIHQRIAPEMVAFAVEFVLSQAGTWKSKSVERMLQHWCKPTPAEDEADPSQGSPEPVRRWIREVLAEQHTSDLFALLAFDKLAELGELHTETRIEHLRRALAIDDAPVEDDTVQRAYLQALAARRLLELGDRDERIPRVLEAAVHMLARGKEVETFQFASVLRTLQPADEALRHSLVSTVLGTQWDLPIEQVLELLDWVGLSVEERIDVLLERLNSEHGREGAPHFFAALEKLGCPPERRTALLLDFVSRHGAQLPIQTTLTLATRPELPTSAEAKLLLNAIAQTRGWSSKEALERWIERFASKVVLDDEDGWWSYRDSNYLSLRQRTLARLSKVDEPELVERALAELATAHVDALLALYRRARAGPDLTDEEWSALLALLTVGPQDEGTALLAREWLTLGLWQTWEPAKVKAWFRS
jgi:hypothetical protein